MAVGPMFFEFNMFLSIIIPGKIDNFRTNNSKVLELNLHRTISSMSHLHYETELLFCDWGSEVKVFDFYNIKTTATIKNIYVKPEICAKYNRQSDYSIVHPINTAFRRSRGEYVVFWDADCFVNFDAFQKLHLFVEKLYEMNDKKFYWGSRINIPYNIYYNRNYIELENYINDCPKLEIDKINCSNFEGCAISLLMHRSLWENSTGWWEQLTYWGWQDIEFHRRLLTKYDFGGDLHDNNIYFYHLQSEKSTAKPKYINEQINSANFAANDVNWGLLLEDVQIL